MSDRDWSIEGDGGEPLHVYARGLDRRVAIRASGAVVLDADGLAKVIAELTERLLIMSGRSGLLVMLAEIRALWEAGEENEMAAVAMALLTSLSVVESTLTSERAEHAATLAEIGPPPVVDGRVLGGREAARAFRHELDRMRVDLDINDKQSELWRESRDRLLTERDHIRTLVRSALAVLEHVRAAPGGNVEEARRLISQIVR